MDNNNMKYKRQNLWKRLKPEYKQAIKQQNKSILLKWILLKMNLKANIGLRM